MALFFANPLIGQEMRLSYNFDIRPILSEKCFACHGFDSKTRKADLRLDTYEGATDPEREQKAIVPGDAEASAVIQRILSKDPDEVMPPPERVHQISPSELKVLTRWINEGAKYEPHWSFIAPKRPAMPQVSNSSWVKNPIDSFIATRWEKDGISSIGEADRATLLRRVFIDLIGLPPTPRELSDFLADGSPDAYEKVVDRLLASPHFGERMALPWLDAARYADSNGFQQDGDTHQYVWRDWVIKALNQNMPFDQFTIEQIAGDLLPNSSLSQKVATGFQRCHMLNGEGGAIAEEQRNIILFDRVDVTATNWLGLTLACAQCHDHKYDPLSQKDYYAMMAFFNQVPEKGVPGGSGQYRIADPWIHAGSDEQMAEWNHLTNSIQEAEARKRKLLQEPALSQELKEMEASLLSPESAAWTVATPSSLQATNGVALQIENDQSIISSGPAAARCDYTIEIPVPATGVSGLRFDLIPDVRFPMAGSGRAESGNAVLSKLTIFSGDQVISVSDTVADYSQNGFSPNAILDNDPDTGWAFVPDVKTPHFIAVEFSHPIRTQGKNLRVVLSFQSKHIAHMFGRFRISLTHLPAPLARAGLPKDLQTILQKDAEKRNAAESQKINDYLAKRHPRVSAMQRQIDQSQAKLDRLKNELPRVMVMSDAQPRKTYIYDRGSYETPKQEVTSDTPAVLPPMPADQPKNRLGLAKWIMSENNPLTARVHMNRIWQLYFGKGIVKTAENFGLGGELPTHPELLDWLAVEFRESGWNMKHMHRLIVTSATYRQSSRITNETLQRDPENKLYARASRFRMPSLLLRDYALQTSGLLQSRLFGKPVYPYQPATIWDNLSITKERDFTYPLSQGADLYRRSIYTFWRRTAAPGNMFDSAARRTCEVKMNLTSSPLHALTMMNDTTWVEASRMLAERVMQSGVPAESWVTEAFLRVCLREADAVEKRILLQAWEKSFLHFQQQPQAIKELLGIGSSPRDTKLDALKHAALTHVCLTIYNLDEALTRQ
ncbi:MAG: hypothetical protein RLZZ553_1195 [Verrucomicrobiota bacterium]|jgi:hypothetical protein